MIPSFAKMEVKMIRNIFPRFCALPLPRSWFKGHDTAAACRYLEHKFEKLLKDGCPHKAYLESIHKALHSGNEFLRRVYRCHLFLRRPETRHLAYHGNEILKNYCLAANHAHALGKTRFKLIPKLHMFCHMVRILELSSKTQKWTMSPAAYMCQMDEDLVGRISTMSQTTSIRTVHEQTIRKYLVTVRLNLQPPDKDSGSGEIDP